MAERPKNRVLRGGSWNNNDPDNLLSSNRNNNTPTNRNDNNGFRVVVVVGSGGKASGCVRCCNLARFRGGGLGWTRRAYSR